MLNETRNQEIRHATGQIVKTNTSDVPKIPSKTGRSSRRTGRIWSSVRSDLMNSVKTCIAPCTESGDPDDRRPINDVNRSGYSSGQSQFAIEESVCAYRASYKIKARIREGCQCSQTGCVSFDLDLKDHEKQLPSLAI